MIGITAYGLYLPACRLKNETISQAWDRPVIKGEKAVANYDEDSLTLGLAAAFNCLGETEGSSLDGLFFASTTSPYSEKSVSSFLATALGLPEGARACDFAGSLKCGSNALLAALDGLKAGSISNGLVVAADCRLAPPGNLNEPYVGDGACALSLGKSGAIATLIDSYTVFDEYTPNWRRSGALYFDSDDPRFSQLAGYSRSVKTAISGLLSKAQIKPADIAKVATIAPDLRSQMGLVKELGFDPNKQLQDSLAASTGLIGSAHPLLCLAAALSEAEPGQKILFAAYGDGADAILFEVTSDIAEFKKRQVMKRALAHRRELKSYAKFLAFRQLIKGEESPFKIFTSTSMHLRERELNLKLYGLKCTGCGNIYHLQFKVCPHCRSKDKFDRVKLARTGKIFTFTQEYYFPAPESPVPMAVIDLDSGGRLIAQMIDTDPEEVKVGLKVELTLRRLHEAGGFYNYYWKCRPVREG